jgi:hypothetical protein
MTLTELGAYSDGGPRRRARQSYTSRIRREGFVVRQLAAELKPADPSSDYSSDLLRKKLKKALPPEYGKKFAPHFEKLDALATDRSLLVGCTAPPSALTLTCARAILGQLETEALEPTRVVASSEGGVAICFVSGDKYSDIECLNSEEILGVISNRRDHPVVWEIEPSASGFARAAARIRDFLATGSHDP